MRHSELIDCLQNLMGFVPKSTSIAKILNLPVRTIYTRTQRDSVYSPEEIKLLECYYAIDLSEENMLIPINYYKQLSGKIENNEFKFTGGKETLFFPKALMKKLYDDNKKYFLIQASGDCMSPYINDKDYLVIEKYQTEQINDNDVYLFSYKDVIFIRRISKNIDGLILKSDNPNYKSEDINESDMHNLFIIGQVAGVFRYSL